MKTMSIGGFLVVMVNSMLLTPIFVVQTLEPWNRDKEEVGEQHQHLWVQWTGHTTRVLDLVRTRGQTMTTRGCWGPPSTGTRPPTSPRPWTLRPSRRLDTASRGTVCSPSAILRRLHCPPSRMLGTKDLQSSCLMWTGVCPGWRQWTRSQVQSLRVKNAQLQSQNLDLPLLHALQSSQSLPLKMMNHYST